MEVGWAAKPCMVLCKMLNMFKKMLNHEKIPVCHALRQLHKMSQHLRHIGRKLQGPSLMSLLVDPPRKPKLSRAMKGMGKFQVMPFYNKIYMYLLCVTMKEYMPESRLPCLFLKPLHRTLLLRRRQRFFLHTCSIICSIQSLL